MFKCFSVSEIWREEEDARERERKKKESERIHMRYFCVVGQIIIIIIIYKNDIIIL